MRSVTMSLAGLLALALFTACGGGGGVLAGTPASSGGNLTGSSASENTGLAQASWSSNVSVTYPTSCTMRYTTTGVPAHATSSSYLEPPHDGYTAIVATTPLSMMGLAVVPYVKSANSTSVVFNTCPTYSAVTTPSGRGPIGWMISGAPLFNATEGDGTTDALQDNVTYVSGATSYAFLDSCDGHPTPAGESGQYHYHGLPACVTAGVDTATGPSHLIGIALDGFPIYGNRDISGALVTVSQLDACDGITSATPEFPNGIYHYVLPAGVTGAQSSLPCFHGR